MAYTIPLHMHCNATRNVIAQSDRCQCAVVPEKLNHFDSRIKMLLQDLFLKVVAKFSGKKHILGVTKEWCGCGNQSAIDSA